MGKFFDWLLRRARTPEGLRARATALELSALELDEEAGEASGRKARRKSWWAGVLRERAKTLRERAG